MRYAAVAITPITTGAAISALATAISVTAGVLLLHPKNLQRYIAMTNDCKGCTVRRIGCHANRSSYQAFRAENDKRKAAARNEYPARELLVTGYIKRARAVKTFTTKKCWRYRGT